MSEVIEGINPSDDFEALQSAFLMRVDLRLKCMNNLFEQWVTSTSAQESVALSGLYHEIHKLAGAASCYQVHDLAAAAQELEDLVYSISPALLLAPDKSNKIVQVRKQLERIECVYRKYQ